MQMMYAGADAFVLPTHGEGWGRPAVEAMAMALPTIVTNWSGTSQFLSDTATYPIPVPELEDSKQGQCLHENDVKSAVLRSDYIARYVHSARGCCCFCFVFLCFFWGGGGGVNLLPGQISVQRLFPCSLLWQLVAGKRGRCTSRGARY